MIWNRSGECGMISPPYRCGKFFIDGCSMYGLWHEDEHLGYFECFEDAQQAAEKHQGAQQVMEGRT